MGSIIKELKRFCQATSIKGIPRTFRDQPLILRAIWIIGILTFFSIAIHQTVDLTKQYFAHETVTLIHEEILNFPGAPDVMVCNMKPFSSLTPQMDNISSVQDFKSHLEAMLNCSNCSAEELEKLTYMKHRLSTAEGYYQYIGKKAAVSISHAREDIFVDCGILSMDGATQVLVPCLEGVNVDFKHHISNSYYNCYKVHPTAQYALGWSFISYIDDFYTDGMDNFDAHAVNGLTISLVEARTLGSGLSAQIWLSPGTSNNIQFEPQERQNLPEPYGDCKDEGYEGEKYKMPFKKTPTSCLSLCFETEVAINCSCRDPQSQILLDNLGLMADLPYCTDSKLLLQDMMNKFNCAQTIKESLFQDCVNACHMPCYRKLYSYTVTNIPWPTVRNVRAFYKDYIQGRRYERNFKAAWIEASLANGSNAKLYELISKNFVHYELFPTDYTYIRLQQQSSLKMVNFLSQLGGILNLFSGISVIVAIEIIELIIRLFCKENSTTPVKNVELKPTESRERF